MAGFMGIFKMTVKNNPLVSIIIPIHNAEKYITECLSSIVNQTYKNLEILCIDDHSIDNTKQIVQQFAQKDSRIILKDSEGKFIGGTRNTGLKYANGEYVLFIDCDDWFAENVCELAIEKYNQFAPDLVVYYAKEVFADKKENTGHKKSIFDITYTGLLNIDDKKRFMTINTAWNKMYKKSIIDKYNIKFLEDSNLEDVGFWWKYNQVIKKVYYIDEYLYFYRMHCANTIKRQDYKESLADDSIKIMADVLKFLEDNNLTETRLPSYILFVNSFVQDFYRNKYKNDFSYLKNVSNFIKNSKTLSKSDNKFIKNMIEEDFYKIPEFGLYKPYEYVFSVKEGLQRLYVTVLGAKLKFKLYKK